MAGDWRIGSDSRRRTTDQLRGFREANDGQVVWDTEAPADFTYVFHPDRVLVRVADTAAFDRAVDRLDKEVLLGSPRVDADLLDGELLRYLLPERSGGQSVPDVLDLLEASGLPRGAASPDHWVHVARAVPVAACARPSRPRRPVSPTRGRPRRRTARDGRSASWSSTPAGTPQPRPTRVRRG